MGSNLRDIVKKECQKKGISLSKLAIILKVNHVYLFGVLAGRKVSRPLIRRLAEVLDLPNLPSQYELFLKHRKNKSEKRTKTKTKPIKEVEQ
jgi:plasmid maintenance system antidote protein VapI